MNLKKIKLALTIDLLNQKSNRNLLTTTREIMSSLKEEVGKFLSQELIKARTSGNLIKQSYALQYEKGTLNLDVVFSPSPHNQYIYSFDFR